MDSKIEQAVHSEYDRVLKQLDEISEAYGTNSPLKYLSDYSPRIKAQIQTLLGLIRQQGSSAGSLLSIGGWPGVSGIVLKQITGIQVTLLDHPAVLGAEFSDFYDKHGLKVVPFDICHSVRQQIPVEQRFDLIECCQCIEHWNFNPVFAFRDVFGRILKPSGHMLITVPNAVSLYRRLFTLMGNSPYPSMQSFIESAEGLPGAEVSPHWREYTRQDLLRLLDYAGGKVVHIRTYHPKLLYKMSMAQKIHQGMHNLHPSLKSNLEVIARPR